MIIKENVLFKDRVCGFIITAILFIMVSTNHAFAVDQVFYIDDEGCSDDGMGSDSQPWCTFSHAFSPSGMGAGDILVVKDGNYINNIMVDPPSGTSTHPTIIRAENDGQATVDDQQANTGDYPGNVLQVSRGTEYVQIDGLRFLNGNGHVAAIGGQNIQIKNCAFANADPDKTVVALTGRHILLEDSWVWGAGCSMVYIGAGIHGDDPDVWGDHITLRRVVVRCDYAACSDSNGVLMYGAAQVELENVIALDFNAATDVTPVHYRNGFRSREGYSATDHMYTGCIALNLPADRLGYGYQGFELTRVGQARNCVAWDVANDAFAMRGWDPDLSLEHITAGVAERGVLFRNQTLVNSLVMHTNTNDLTAASTHNHFFESPEGGQNTTTGDPGLIYLLQIEPQSPGSGTANDGGNRGATILYRTVDGNLTNTPLWPWPNEARIKQDFSTTFDSIPAEFQNPRRGFCADGQNLSGGPITLTSYIWEYLDEPCPEHICTSTANIPSAPKNLRVE